MTGTASPDSTGLSGDVSFDPFAPGYLEDPYPQFASLREHDPAHRTPFGGLLLTRHEDNFAVLRDSSLSVEDRHLGPNPLDDLAREVLGDRVDEQRAQGLSMLDRDPPDHTRLRKLVSRAFTPRRIAELRPRIQELVDARLDRAAEEGRMDAIGDLAFPLPFDVITEMMGMPDADRDRIRTLSGTLVRSLEPVVDPDLLLAIADAGDEMGAHIDAAIAWKKDHPADDLLTLLIDARLPSDDDEDDGDRLTDDELAAQVALLFIAGHETTVNLIGNGLLALLRHPEQLDRLRDEPDLIDNAVDEFLRYDAPVQMSRRITIRGAEIAGVEVEAGSFVLCGLASSNRDEDRFGPTADTLDIGRTDAHDHLSFGGGAHYCLGASLAKLEAAVAVGTLVQRFERIELDGEPVYNGRINLRGLDELPLRLT